MIPHEKPENIMFAMLDRLETCKYGLHITGKGAVLQGLLGLGIGGVLPRKEAGQFLRNWHDRFALNIDTKHGWLVVYQVLAAKITMAGGKGCIAVAKLGNLAC